MKYFFLLVSLLMNFSTIAHAKRIALVIGNDDYIAVTKLQKAVNDATAIAGTLEDTGFQVFLIKNANRQAMNRQLGKLSAKIEAGDEVMFYFSGHGVAVRGVNYLLPIDIPKLVPSLEHSIAKEAFSEDEIITLIKERGAKVTVMIIDACRNNPFPRKGTRGVGRSVGLVRTAAPAMGTFIMYSAGIGQEALDRLSEADANPNSVFTRKLLPLLKTPGLDIAQMTKGLRIDVRNLALAASPPNQNHKQFPAYYDQMEGDFYFVPGDVKSAGIPLVKINQEHALWKTIETSNKSTDFEFYLQRFPKGIYAAVAKLKLQQFSRKQEQPTSVKQKDHSRKAVENEHSVKPKSKDQDCDREEYTELKELESIEAWNDFLQRCKNGRLARLALNYQTKLKRRRAIKDEEKVKENARLKRESDLQEQLLSLQKEKIEKWDNQQQTNTRSLGRAEEPAYAPPLIATGPSFKCILAKSPTELTICKHVILMTLDLKMAGLYGIVEGRQSSNGAKRLRNIQRAWLKRRNNCNFDSACIETAYKQQIFQLQNY